MTLFNKKIFNPIPVKLVQLFILLLLLIACSEDFQGDRQSFS
ncbi:MAG: hypothetical protein ACI9FN_003214 [Saprospiraceae bacterium]|jgi:hypothetical protein